MVSKKGSRTIRLPDDLDKNLRIVAAQRRSSVSGLIAEAVKLWLQQQPEISHEDPRKSA